VEKINGGGGKLNYTKLQQGGKEASYLVGQGKGQKTFLKGPSWGRGVI